MVTTVSNLSYSDAHKIGLTKTDCDGFHVINVFGATSATEINSDMDEAALDSVITFDGEVDIAALQAEGLKASDLIRLIGPDSMDDALDLILEYRGDNDLLILLGAGLDPRVVANLIRLDLVEKAIDVLMECDDDEDVLAVLAEELGVESMTPIPVATDARKPVSKPGRNPFLDGAPKRNVVTVSTPEPTAAAAPPVKVALPEPLPPVAEVVEAPVPVPAPARPMPTPFMVPRASKETMRQRPVIRPNVVISYGCGTAQVSYKGQTVHVELVDAASGLYESEIGQRFDLYDMRPVR